MTYARTETFEHTISGLLTKRADLLGEAETIRNRMAEIKNDISALDRVLTGTLGYTGDLDGSAEMNIWLHKATMRQLAANGGKVPAALVD